MPYEAQTQTRTPDMTQGDVRTNRSKLRIKIYILVVISKNSLSFIFFIFPMIMGLPKNKETSLYNLNTFVSLQNRL